MPPTPPTAPEAWTTRAAGDEAYLTLDAEWRFTFANDAAERLLGAPRESLLGRVLWDVASLAADAALWRECRRAVAARTPVVLQGRSAALDRWIDAHVEPLDAGVAIHLRDATERRAREARLRLLETALDRSHDVVVVGELAPEPGTGGVLYANETYERLLGRTRADATSRSSRGLFPFQLDGDAAARIVDALRRGEAGRAELPTRTASGETVWLEVDLAPVAATHWIAVCRDITERRHALEVLRDREAQYRVLFESHPLPLWVYDLETLRFLAVNDAAVAAYGFSRAEFAAMTIRDIRPVEDVPALVAQLARPQTSLQNAGRFRHRRKDGTVAHVEIVSHVVEWEGRRARLVLAIDVTERTRLEAQLRHVDKMDAVGQLAGGVAHDFNNLLTAIVGNLELAAGAIDPASAAAADIAEATRAAQRAASLTRQLLVFSRKQSLQLRHLDPNAIVRDAERMLRRVVGENVLLETDLAPDAGTIVADGGQLEQAVLNLVLNARDAMASKGGGAITLATRNLEVTADDAARCGLSRGGAYVSVAVRDTGVGMDAATQARIFEPFFTTKPVGKGTGLGLAMVHGFAVQAGGAVRVQSAPGQGSTFELLFPQINARPVRPAAPTGRGAAPGTETVLLAEDETPVRALARRVLERHGYRVLEARHGVDALALWRAHRGEIALLLSDVRMPEMGGRELAAAVRREQPALPVLFMSGYPDDAPGAAGPEAPVDRLVEKPFTADQLAAAVREALDRARRS